MDPEIYKVSISCLGQTVTFEASTPVTESRTASWDQYNIVHLPTSLFAYRGTSHRSFQVSGKLISRTAAEATENAKKLNLVRSWVLPDFGGTGASPPIVTLTAYANTNIRKLKCFVRTYSWQFTDEVDYVFTGQQPMPVIGILSVDLEEIYSAQEITQKTPWKIRDTDGSLLANSTIASLSSNVGFQGIASIANSQIDSLLSPITNDLSSLLSQNPLTEAVSNTLNSPEVSEAKAAISQVANNPFITGANSVPLGEIGGVPQGTLGTVVAPQDSFGRISLSNIGPTFKF